MFIKPFKIKNNVQLKATEKKKFRTKLGADYPDVSEENLNAIVPNKASVFMIKIITHNGIQVTVYSVDKRPMFFEFEDRLYPTVYSLWLVHDIVPEFTTLPMVFPKLANGADLMIPGIIKKDNSLDFWGRYKKGQPVYVNLTSNRAAIGIGYLPHCSEDMYMMGGHGVGVKMLHIFGDKLWCIEPTVCLQVPNLDSVTSVPKLDDFPSLGDSMLKHVKPPHSEAPTSSTMVDTNKNLTEVNGDDVAKLSIQDEPNIEHHEIVSEAEPALVDMDTILKNAFLTAIKLNKNKFQLPILTSNFYRLHVLPTSSRPIDIKLSSYKKVSKFLDKMSSEGFIIVKEETKGVEKITEIDFSHPELLEFKPEFVANTNESSGGEASSATLFQTTVAETFEITEEVKDFFRYFKLATNSMEKKEVLKCIKDYVGQQKIKPDPITKLLHLNELLAQICEKTEVKDTNEILSIVLSKMKLCYEMRNQPQTKGVSGKTVPIQMTLATRSGNKKVTLVNNLEQYGIIINEFAKSCKVGAAASTSVSRPPGAKFDQLLVQGNQVKFLYDLLTETYKIAPKNIQGLEFAKKDKKKRK